MVLLDRVFDRGDGLDALPVFLQAGVRVIMMTASYDRATARRATMAGAWAYVEKSDLRAIHDLVLAASLASPESLGALARLPC